MSWLRKRLTAFGVIAMAFAIGACSASAPTVTESTATSDAVAVPNITTPVFVSPLDEFLGQSVWTNQEEHQRAVDQFIVRREELIAQCMSQAGFNYQPDLNSDSFTIGNNAFDDVHPNDWEWVSQFGFGIVSGHAMRSGGTFGERDDDPNREYVAGLSETAREAFELALNGPEDFSGPQGPSQADWDEWMKTRGCTGQAIVQAMSENPLFLQNDDQFASLFEARNAMLGAVWEHPDIAELDREWSHCMADGGHPGLNTRDGVSGPIWSEYFPTAWAINAEREAGTLDEAGGAARLAELQAREVELALADFDCRAATDYEARVNAIRLELETQFVTDNRALLEDFRTAADLAG